MAVWLLESLIPFEEEDKPSNIRYIFAVWPYDCMAVGILDLLGRGRKPSNIPGGIFWSN
jgi:hypothetical protein